MSELAQVAEDILQTQAQIRRLNDTSGSPVNDALAAMRAATTTIGTIRKLIDCVRAGTVKPSTAIDAIERLLS